MHHLSVILFLLPIAFTASFESQKCEKKLEFSQLKRASVLVGELSESEGVSELAGVSIPEWVEYVMATNAPVSENVARWVMFKHFQDNWKDQRFFHYVMDNFGYASLVKDWIDYMTDPMDHVVEYLNKHRLRHFPNLPDLLRKAAEQVNDFGSCGVYRYLLPLLSDHSIKHPAIIQKFAPLNIDFDYPMAYKKIILICWCLGSMDMKLELRNRDYDYALLTIIDEVSREFPEKMSEIIAKLPEFIFTHFQIIQSGLPPTETVWKRSISSLGSPESYWGNGLFSNAPLTLGLIRHLFLNHPEWIRDRFMDFNANARTLYLLNFPDDTQLDFLPDETPAPNYIAPLDLTPAYIPFYRHLITKYGVQNLKDAVSKCHQLKVQMQFCDKTAAKRMHQLIRISDPKYDLPLAGQASFNKFFTTLHYVLNDALWNDEFTDWFFSLLFGGDPTTWILFVLQAQ